MADRVVGGERIWGSKQGRKIYLSNDPSAGGLDDWETSTQGQTAPEKRQKVKVGEEKRSKRMTERGETREVWGVSKRPYGQRRSLLTRAEDRSKGCERKFMKFPTDGRTWTKGVGKNGDCSRRLPPTEGGHGQKVGSVSPGGSWGGEGGGGENERVWGVV